MAQLSKQRCLSCNPENVTLIPRTHEKVESTNSKKFSSDLQQTLLRSKNVSLFLPWLKVRELEDAPFC